jgi:hypothetical protein
MRTFTPALSAVLMALAILLSLPHSALAQPEPFIVIEDSGHAGIFCSYDWSESGDSGPMITFLTDKGAFSLYDMLPVVSDSENLSKLRDGTHFDFSYRILYAYSELDGGMVTISGITEVKPAEGGRDTSACMGLEPYQSFEYAADKVPGYFCGYTPGRGGAADTVTIRTAKGLYGFRPRLDSFETMKTLSELSQGTPINYDMKFERPEETDGAAFSPPPVVTLSGFSTSGEPMEGACNAIAK